MRIEVSQVVDRPPAEALRFVAVDHVRNYPRWDTKMELEQLSEGPIGVGTLVRRRHTRADAPVDGMMGCVGFEPDRAIAWLIHDGPVEMHGRVAIEPEGRDRSRLTVRSISRGWSTPSIRCRWPRAPAG